MKVCYACEPFRELDITATSSEWIDFARAIATNGYCVRCQEVYDPTPYDHSTTKVTIVHASGQKVEFTNDKNGDIVLSGDALQLATLAKTADSFGRSFPDGSHIHIDYQGDEHYVGKGSMSTVFQKSEKE